MVKSGISSVPSCRCSSSRLTALSSAVGQPGPCGRRGRSQTPNCSVSMCRLASSTTDAASIAGVLTRSRASASPNRSSSRKDNPGFIRGYRGSHFFLRFGCFPWCDDFACGRSTHERHGEHAEPTVTPVADGRPVCRRGRGRGRPLRRQRPGDLRRRLERRGEHLNRHDVQGQRRVGGAGPLGRADLSTTRCSTSSGTSSRRWSTARCSPSPGCRSRSRSARTRGAPTGPVVTQAAAGAEVVVNINASPYYAGRVHEREAMLAQRALDAEAPIVYVNLVGGQDELVFDGASMVDRRRRRRWSRVAASSRRTCSSSTSTCDAPTTGAHPPAGRGPSPCRPSRCRRATSACRRGRRASSRSSIRCRRSTGRSCSARATTCRRTGSPTWCSDCRAASTRRSSPRSRPTRSDPTGAPVCCMPSRDSSEGSITDAEALADARHRHADDPDRARGRGVHHDARRQRSPAPSPVSPRRTSRRGCAARSLMTISNKFGWLVLTTGNKSEMATGYSTLYGDMAGGFAVIKDVPKMLVYALCEDLNRRADREVVPRAVIEKPPSAELRPDQKDEDSLPPYAVLDQILEGYVEDDRSIADLVAVGFDRDTVVRVAVLVDRLPSTSAARPHPARGCRRRRSARTGACRSPTAGPAEVVGRLRAYLPELALALASALYGSTFVLVQDALDDVTPSAFNVLRFGVAALALLPLVVRRDLARAGSRVRPTRVGRCVGAGVVLGLIGRRGLPDPERRPAPHVDVELELHHRVVRGSTPLIAARHPRVDRRRRAPHPRPRGRAVLTNPSRVVHRDLTPPRHDARMPTMLPVRPRRSGCARRSRSSGPQRRGVPSRHAERRVHPFHLRGLRPRLVRSCAPASAGLPVPRQLREQRLRGEDRDRRRAEHARRSWLRIRGHVEHRADRRQALERVRPVARHESRPRTPPPGCARSSSRPHRSTPPRRSSGSGCRTVRASCRCGPRRGMTPASLSRRVGPPAAGSRHR